MYRPSDNITWNFMATNPVALVLMDWGDGGTTVYEMGDDDMLYGLIDIEAGCDHDTQIHIIACHTDLPVIDRRAS